MSIDFIKAHAAGLAAVEAMAEPKKYVVNGYEDSPFELCGFASVIVRGIRGNARKEFEAQGFRQSDYEKALVMSVRYFEQSHPRKERYAQAYAAELKAQGIARAYSDSRLD